MRSAFLEGIGSNCTHEAGTAGHGFKSAAASLVDDNRSRLPAASKVVTYLDETCEKRRRICGRPWVRALPYRFRGRNQCSGLVGEYAGYDLTAWSADYTRLRRLETSGIALEIAVRMPLKI